MRGAGAAAAAATLRATGASLWGVLLVGSPAAAVRFGAHGMLLPGACPHNCSGHGACTPTGACVCFLPWAGASCEVEILEAACNTTCSGHGWCRGDACICDEFWRGAHCEQPSKCPNGCSGFGHCVDGKWCRCDADHYGADCSRPRDRCPGWPRACGGVERGTCADSGECVCRPAWRGAACEISTAWRPCKGNCSWPRGVCDPEGSGYCQCGAEWEGERCERRLGALSVGEVLLRVLLGLVATLGVGVGGVLAWCMRVRGVMPRDVLKGNWHVRKEEGWRKGEAEGQMPNARFEIFGEWVPPTGGAAGPGGGAAAAPGGGRARGGAASKGGAK